MKDKYYYRTPHQGNEFRICKIEDDECIATASSQLYASVITELLNTNPIPD
jgi:hypothetical protein